MKLPIQGTLNRQDFPEAPSWISKLLYPLQQFQNSVYRALTNGLSVEDNFSGVVRRFSVVAGAADTDNVVSFPCVLGRQIVEANVYCTNADNTYTPVYPQISWNLIGTNFVINGIKGLTPTKKYNFVVTVR